MIGERLKEERKRLGFNQDAFSEFAGVTKRPYIDWEAGKTSPTVLQLAALAAIAPIDVLYIVNGVRQENVAGTMPEISLLQCYRAITDTERLAVNRLLTTLAGIAK